MTGLNYIFQTEWFYSVTDTSHVMYEFIFLEQLNENAAEILASSLNL